MNMQTYTNWSCLPCAFAMALDMAVEKFIDTIGHDGSDEPYAGLPGQKAGFHEQECIEVCQQFGYACTPIEIVPQMMPVPDGPVRQIWFRPEQRLTENWARFRRHLEGTRGVLTGVKKRLNEDAVGHTLGHAVAWNGMIYDPQGKGFIYLFENAYQFGFVPRTYWKIQEVMNGRGREDGSFNTSTEEA